MYTDELVLINYWMIFIVFIWHIGTYDYWYFVINIYLLYTVEWVGKHVPLPHVTDWVDHSLVSSTLPLFIYTYTFFLFCFLTLSLVLSMYCFII